MVARQGFRPLLFFGRDVFGRHGRAALPQRLIQRGSQGGVLNRLIQRRVVAAKLYPYDSRAIDEDQLRREHGLGLGIAEELGRVLQLVVAKRKGGLELLLKSGMCSDDMVSIAVSITCTPRSA